MLKILFLMKFLTFSKNLRYFLYNLRLPISLLKFYMCALRISCNCPDQLEQVKLIDKRDFAEDFKLKDGGYMKIEQYHKNKDEIINLDVGGNLI